MSAHARRTDPETSHAAARSLSTGAMRASHRFVLRLFTLYGDMDDETLGRVAASFCGHNPDAPKLSPSGLRSRRSELSKPNEERLTELRRTWYETYNPGDLEFAGTARGAHNDGAADRWARTQLQAEGFRAPLWDTGRRLVMRSGRKGVIWGLVPDQRHPQLSLLNDEPTHRP